MASGTCLESVRERWRNTRVSIAPIRPRASQDSEPGGRLLAVLIERTSQGCDLTGSFEQMCGEEFAADDRWPD